MFFFDEEKENLTKELSDQYSQNTINMEEYERLLEYLNKIETKKEIAIIAKIIQENKVKDTGLAPVQNTEISIGKTGEKHLSMFSWRSSNVKPVNGNGGTFMSLFGANRIIVDSLPRGRTVINVNSIFGLIEIIVAKNIRIVNKTMPVFAGIFQSKMKEENFDDESPELYITGNAIFGNITIKSVEEFEKYNKLTENWKIDKNKHIPANIVYTKLGEKTDGGR